MLVYLHDVFVGMKNWTLIVGLLLAPSLAFTQELDVLLDSAVKSQVNSYTYFSKANSILKTNADSLNFLQAKTERVYKEGLNDSVIYFGKLYIQKLKDETIKQDAIFMARRLSRTYINQGVYESALEFAQLALKYAEQLNDANNIAFQLADIAVIYHDFEDYENGVKYGKLCFQRAVELGAESQHQAFCLNAIAINFDDWAKPDSALYYHFKVFELDPMPDSLSIQFTFNNIGNTLMKKGEYARAEPFFATSLKLARKRAIPYRYYALAGSFTNLGQLKSKQKQYAQASIFFDSALHYSLKSNSLEKIRDTYFDIYTFHKELGNFEKALSFQDKYYTLRDSIFRIERLKAVGEAEAKYQSAIKDKQLLEREADLLEKETRINQIIIIAIFLLITIGLLTIILLLNRNRFKKKQEILEKEKEIHLREAAIQSAIASQENERRRFAQDLHDGFGQLISALRLHLDQLDQEKNPENKMRIFEKTEQLIEEMHKEIRNIAFNLMPTVLINQGLTAALEEFVLRLNSAGKVMIKVSQFGINERLSELQEINLYRIVQEWTNNILKYSAADKIDIQLVQHEDSLTLTIEDDGAGFDIAKLYSSKGNGWKNMQSRINLMQGKADIDSREGQNGSTLIIEIPLQHTFAKQISAEYLKEGN